MGLFRSPYPNGPVYGDEHSDYHLPHLIHFQQVFTVQNECTLNPAVEWGSLFYGQLGWIKTWAHNMFQSTAAHLRPAHTHSVCALLRHPMKMFHIWKSLKCYDALNSCHALSSSEML